MYIRIEKSKIFVHTFMVKFMKKNNVDFRLCFIQFKNYLNKKVKKPLKILLKKEKTSKN